MPCTNSAPKIVLWKSIKQQKHNKTNKKNKTRGRKIPELIIELDLECCHAVRETEFLNCILKVANNRILNRPLILRKAAMNPWFVTLISMCLRVKCACSQIMRLNEYSKSALGSLDESYNRDKYYYCHTRLLYTQFLPHFWKQYEFCKV